MENIAQIHSKLDKMPDSYLSELVQNKSPFATVAAMVLDTRQGMAQKMTEPPTSTVADKVAAQTGLPSVAQPQNNQDPRLMAGVGNMPITPRDSVDTPMTGVAQLPAKQMMADGGIVGYQKGGDVEPATFFGEDSDKLRYIRENPLEAASYGLLAVPGAGLVGLGGRAALAGGRALLGSRLGQGVKNYFTKRTTKRGTQADELGLPLRAKYTSSRGPNYGRIIPAASGVAGLGGLIASSDFSGGEEEKALEQPNFNSDMPDKSSFDKEGFMKDFYRQMQLTGRNVATDKSGQGILGSVLGGYGKATGDLAASDEAQENKLAQLGVSALAKGRVTPADRIRAIKIIDERKLNQEYRQEAINAVEANPAAVQTMLRNYGIVASGEEQLLAEYENLLAEIDGAEVLNQISGVPSAPSTAGYSIAPSTAG